LKSFEFLVALFIIALIFSPLYSVAKSEQKMANNKLEEFKDSIEVRTAESMIIHMKAYGEPFSYDGFGNFSKLGIEGASFNPLTGTYTYATYSRWNR